MSSEEVKEPVVDAVPVAEGQIAEGKKKRKKKSSATSTKPINQPLTPDAEETARILELMEKLNIKQPAPVQKKAETLEEAQVKDYKFWDSQPVTQLGVEVTNQGVIQPLDLATVPKEPYPLPANYEWCSMDLESTKDLDDFYDLLNVNYVEDSENMFRFDYSKNFLRWAMMAPGWKKQWHVGVRVSTGNKKLVAFIGAIPAAIRVDDDAMPMVEINYLCVHKKLRSKRLAPMLIKEVTRRVNLEGISMACYTAGVYLPTPVCSTRYFHRNLNCKKLIDIGFSYLPRGLTLQQLIRRHKLPENPTTKGMRPLEMKDVPSAHKLLSNYLQKFKLAPVFDEAEFAHWFLPKTEVVYCYVVEDPVTHEITDMISFYILNSTIINNTRYKTLNAAFSFYNVATSTTMENLLYDSLILAHKTGHDVYSCLDLLDNDVKVLDKLKFGMGDGHLQ
eukprot:Ihof_evm3s134 gene=Ihof_evmTU3s134